MFNIKDILNKILESFKIAYLPKWDAVKTVAAEILFSSEDRLKTLAEERLAGRIDNTFMVERLKEELTILESELISFEIIAESEVQDLINKAVDLFNNAVNNSIIPEATKAANKADKAAAKRGAK